jgi:hypothetical protein
MSYLVLNQPFTISLGAIRVETGDLKEAKALLESLACEGLFARRARNVASLADLGGIKLEAVLGGPRGVRPCSRSSHGPECKIGAWAAFYPQGRCRCAGDRG